VKRLRLIACDLDRTLLREDKTLSPYTLSVLERCRALGILFVPATARPPRTLEGLIPSLTYDGALCHNGGVALFGGKIMWEQGIASDLAARLLLQFQEEFPGTTISAEMGGELYANFPAETIWKDIAYHRSDFSNLPGCPAEKLILGLTAPEQVQRVEALLPPELYAQVAENTILTIQPRGVNKGAGLFALCEKLSISPEETVSFGDDWNDIPLLQTSGTGVAVENALPEVKAIANEVCASNEADGPAHWLEERLFPGE